MTEFQRRSLLVDGLTTGYLEAGQGDPIVLLHGGEFGVTAELAWERNIAALAERHLANDRNSLTEVSELLGFTAPSAFSRWFRQRFGVSPNEWRSVAQRTATG